MTARVFGWLLIGSALTSLGCRVASSRATDNPGFMDMWETYEHCRASRDTAGILADATKLKYGARRIELRRLSSTKSFAAIRPFLSPLPSRLSVDPDAMMRACALHGSEIAREAGQDDIERELLLLAASLDKPPSLGTE